MAGPIAVRLFRPAPPITYLGIASYYDEGDEGVRVAHIIAHSPQAARDRFADEIFGEYGTSLAEIESRENDGFDDPVVIKGIEIYTEAELREIDVLTTVPTKMARGSR